MLRCGFSDTVYSLLLCRLNGDERHNHLAAEQEAIMPIWVPVAVVRLIILAVAWL
jgi:hypothetical protein